MPLNFQCVYLRSARGASKGEIITTEGPDLISCSKGIVRRLSSPELWIRGCWLRHMSLRGICLQAELETRMLNLRPRHFWDWWRKSPDSIQAQTFGARRFSLTDLFMKVWCTFASKAQNRAETIRCIFSTLSMCFFTGNYKNPMNHIGGFCEYTFSEFLACSCSIMLFTAFSWIKSLPVCVKLLGLCKTCGETVGETVGSGMLERANSRETVSQWKVLPLHE